MSCMIAGHNGLNSKFPHSTHPSMHSAVNAFGDCSALENCALFSSECTMASSSPSSAVVSVDYINSVILFRHMYLGMVRHGRGIYIGSRLFFVACTILHSYAHSLRLPFSNRPESPLYAPPLSNTTIFTAFSPNKCLRTGYISMDLALILLIKDR